MDNKQALEILKQSINYKEDGSTQQGNWILGTDGIEVVKVALSLFEQTERQISQIKYLWGLLDDIDTVGDIAKSNDKAYRNMVENIHPKRQIVAESDGYEIFIKECFIT